MKTVFRRFAFAAALACTLGFAGCNDDDPEPQYDVPEIAIREVTATSSSVTFTLSPTHAVRCTYAVALKGATAAPVEVTGSEPATCTVNGLEADKEYTITAIAYGEGDLRSEPVTSDFVTNSLAQIAIGPVTATYKSATFTLTPLNATGYAYRCNLEAEIDGKTRADGEWVRIEGGEPSEIELTDLTAQSTYTIEAYAINAEGDGKIVTKTFDTEPLPEPLTVRTAATSTAVWAEFTMCGDVTKGYYFYLHDPSYADDPVASIESFLQDLRENPDWYTLLTASGEELLTNCTPATAYKLFTVNTDLEGTVLEATAAEAVITTKPIDALRTSRSAVGIEALTPGYISVEATLEPTDDCVMALIACVKAEDVTRVGTITAYVNRNLQSFIPVLRSLLGESYLIQGIEPETEYVLFTVGIDANGDYGLLDSKEFTTAAVDYLQDVKVGIDVSEAGFKDVTLKVTYDKCASVRYSYMTQKQFVEWYGGDEQNVWKELYTPTADLLDEGDVKIENLDYDSPYLLFALPVTADGKFGQPVKKSFSTSKYSATGTAGLTMTLNEIDRTDSWPVAKFTLTPGDGCAKFIHYAIDEESYALNSAKLGDYLFQMGFYPTVDPAVETQVEVTLWGSDYYLVAVACDAQGQWSRVQVSEKLVFDPNSGGGEDPDPVGDPDEVPAEEISATAATVDFISYLYDQSSWNAEWSDWDNSVYRARITLEAGYTAWYHFVSPDSYDWVVANEVGQGQNYATIALWIKEFGRQLSASGPIAVRGDYGTDYILLVLPETTDGKHASERVYKSPTYRWDALAGDVTDPGIAGGNDGGGDIDPRTRRR